MISHIKDLLDYVESKNNPPETFRGTLDKILDFLQVKEKNFNTAIQALIEAFKYHDDQRITNFLNNFVYNTILYYGSEKSTPSLKALIDYFCETNKINHILTCLLSFNKGGPRFYLLNLSTLIRLINHKTADYILKNKHTIPLNKKLNSIYVDIPIDQIPSSKVLNVIRLLTDETTNFRFEKTELFYAFTKKLRSHISKNFSNINILDLSAETSRTNKAITDINLYEKTTFQLIDTLLLLMPQNKEQIKEINFEKIMTFNQISTSEIFVNTLIKYLSQKIDNQKTTPEINYFLCSFIRDMLRKYHIFHQSYDRFALTNLVERLYKMKDYDSILIMATAPNFTESVSYLPKEESYLTTWWKIIKQIGTPKEKVTLLTNYPDLLMKFPKLAAEVLTYAFEISRNKLKDISNKVTIPDNIIKILPLSALKNLVLKHISDMGVSVFRFNPNIVQERLTSKLLSNPDKNLAEKLNLYKKLYAKNETSQKEVPYQETAEELVKKFKNKEDIINYLDKDFTNQLVAFYFPLKIEDAEKIKNFVKFLLLNYEKTVTGKKSSKNYVQDLELNLKLLIESFPEIKRHLSSFDTKKTKNLK